MTVVAGLERGRILMADDDPQIVRILERMLARAGYTEIFTTTDSSKVLDLFGEVGPDLILLDLTMPPPSGLELLARLSDVVPADSYVPILVLTGDLTREMKEQALAGGAKDFLTKPFDVAEVLLRIGNLLQTRFLHLENRRQNRILEERVRQRTKNLEEARLDILARLARAAEFRDDDTGEHTRRVGEVAAALARQLGMTAEEVEDIRVTAPLHDVGKIGIPDGILLKADSLTTAERRLMETHTSIGAELLAKSPWPLLRMAREIALYHHERWDGSGYPFGLAGKDIPLAARIVAVADVFDALGHERTYRRALARGEVLDQIEAGSGTHFDPRVAKAFLEMHGAGRHGDRPPPFHPDEG